MIVLLTTLLIANPVIVFLLTHSILATIGITGGCVFIVQLTVSPKTPTLVAAYVFNALAVIFIFVHADVVLLYGFPDYVIENLYVIRSGYYFNRALLLKTFTDKEYSVTYRTNSQGLRIGAGHDPTRTATTVDWLVIGDSYAQGAQVEFEDLFSSKLYQRFPDKIIINAGISGFGIGHEYNYFAREGFRYQPNLVILQLCSFNDFMNVEPSLVGLTDRLMTHSVFIRFLLADIKFRNPAALPLGRWTEPFHPTAEANAKFNIFYNRTSPQKEKDLEAFRGYLGQLRQAVEGLGGRLLVVLIPTKEQVYERYLDEVMREFAIAPSSLNMLRPNQLLRDWTKEMNIELLDLLPTFRSAAGNVFFEYDEHLTAFGHSAMAAAIADYLEASRGKSAVQLLSRALTGDRYPMLSQDGSLVSYQAFRDRNMELFVSDPALMEPRRLTFNDVDESHPTLSRDNSKVLFTEGSAESLQTEVVVMNLDGSGRTVLTDDADMFGAIPTFSRSGSQVVYAGWTYDERSQQYTLPQIVLLNLFSGKRTIVTPGEVESWRPVVSPDERHVVYISKRNGQFDLYSYDVITGRHKPLTETPFDEWDPAFTPDGQRLVFSGRPDNNWDLFILDLGTSRVTRLTRSKGDEWDASIAPDGRLVLYAGRFGLVDAMFQMRFQ